MAEAGSAAERVKGPAIGLLVVGILGVVLGLFSLANNIFGFGIGAAQLEELQRSGEEVPEWMTGMMMGGAGAIAILGNVIGLACSAFLIYAAMQMQKLRSHGLAQVASVLAMIPCLTPIPCCCIGLPIGIWSLIVLNKPEVRSSFAP